MKEKFQNKWMSRKLFVFLFLSFNFSGFFIITALVAPNSLIAIGNTIIICMAFFGAAYCGANVLEKFIVLRGAKKDDKTAE